MQEHVFSLEVEMEEATTMQKGEARCNILGQRNDFPKIEEMNGSCAGLLTFLPSKTSLGYELILAYSFRWNIALQTTSLLNVCVETCSASQPLCFG